MIVPAWLQDGTLYGEEGPSLKLDNLMIQAAGFHSKCLNVLSNKTLDLSVHGNELKDCVVLAEMLDDAFAAWPKDLPEGWNFSIPSPEILKLTNSDMLYQGSVHCYTNHGHAIMWNRYRAVRMVVNNLRMRLTSIMFQFAPQVSQASELQETCQEIIGELATDLCYSVSSFSSGNTWQNLHPPTNIDKNLDHSESMIKPNMAAILTWPLIVAISIETVPKTQKLWLQHKLRIISSVIGADALHSVAETI